LNPQGGRGNSRTTLLLGVVLAILGFAVALLLGRSTGPAGPSGPNVPVVAAARDLTPSTKIAAADLIVVQLPSSAAPPHIFHAKDEVVGKVVALEIFANEPVLDNLVVASSDQVPLVASPVLHIPTGYVAMSIPTNELAGVSGNIQAGDYIDILASLNPALAGGQQAPPDRYTFRALQVVKVTGGSGGQGGAATSLVVLVKYDDAPYLKFLLDNTSYKYVLRSNLDATSDLGSGGAVGLNEFKAKFGF
jgi:Flp pilus assembly protein CpaB